MKISKRVHLAVLLCFGFLTSVQAQTPAPIGLVVVQSSHSVDETVTRLEQALEDNGLTIIATVDHAENAASAGLELPPTTLILFGNPQAGTPLMQQQRTIGIDLPQKMLVWQDGSAVYVGYNDPVYLAERHGLDAQSEAVTMVTRALANLAEAAVAP